MGADKAEGQFRERPVFELCGAVGSGVGDAVMSNDALSLGFRVLSAAVLLARRRRVRGFSGNLDLKI